ncbi:TetR/AcrR family transcriptional regulator [Oceanimonas sp. MB9]|uniref:TetR/AcrR family transcriptional regulator n=1 Tax=Oceanimonas sp. MB9 TaxID=2588453 RepID=UPI0013F62BCE|nr:TetR/AcrR family transcriptional regulator [Oceanimonas sp. MB9]
MIIVVRLLLAEPGFGNSKKSGRKFTMPCGQKTNPLPATGVAAALCYYSVIISLLLRAVAIPKKTRDRILAAALELFNERGEARVTTNHIAAYLGISPGNLYYHFRNKNDIVRCIFKQYCAHLTKSFTPATGSASASPALWFHYLDAVFYVMWEFRFFHANLEDILRRDPQLHAQYLEVQRRLEGHLQAQLREFNARQVLAVPEQDIATLAQTLTLMVSCWVSYRRMQLLQPCIIQAVLYEGMVRVLILLKPYFHENKGLELDQILAHYHALAASPGDPFHK